jgi:hypothetical protein
MRATATIKIRDKRTAVIERPVTTSLVTIY